MTGITRIFKVQPGEGRMSLLLIGLMLAASAGMGLGGSGIDALFFARFGVQYLPTMYMLLGVVTLITMLVTSALLTSFDQRQLYLTLPLLLALILGIERAALLFDLTWLYPVIWMVKGVMSSFQGLAMWGLAGTICDTRQARRLFPLFSAGGILGTVLGSSFTPALVGFVHSENLMLVWAGSLVLSYWFGRVLLGPGSAVGGQKSSPAPSRRSARQKKQPGIIAQMRQGFEFVRRSALLSWIALSSFMFSILWFSLEFPFNSAATTAFPDADVLAGFLGLFNGVNTAFALILSLFAANRLFARFGIMTMILVFPTIYLIGFIVLTFYDPFPAVAAVRFAQIGWAMGVAGTAWQAMFNVIPPGRRDQSRAFIELPGQAGILTAGILLALGQQFLQPKQLYLIGLGVAVPILLVMWQAVRAYRMALSDALRAGQPQVFFAEEEPFGGFARDAAAFSALVAGVSDPDPVVRRVSIEVLGNTSVPEAVDALSSALRDADAEVRIAALRALARPGSEPLILRGAACLNDDDPEVRVEAIQTLRLVRDRPPAVTANIRMHLQDQSPTVQARAALALLETGSDPEAGMVLAALVTAASPEARASAMAALGDLKDAAYFDLIAAGLTDLSPLVRSASASAISQTNDPRRLALLVSLLGDPDRSVSLAAAQSIGRIGSAALEPTLDALNTQGLEGGALNALEYLPVSEMAGPLLAYARQRVSDALHYLHLWGDTATPDHDGRVALLARSLKDKSQSHAIRALRAVGLMKDREGVKLALDNLQSANPEQRANALEMLETLGEPDIIRPLLAVWETGETVHPTDSLIHIMRDEDSWLRACGALVAAHSDHWEVKAALNELAESDPDPLVREVALAAIGTVETDAPSGGVTVLERVLLLRQVSLFGNLPPADLKPVAEIAGENSYKSGARIFKQGDIGDEMHIIISGEVRVMISREGRKQAEQARRKSGDVIGELSIINNAPRMASLYASGEVKTLTLGREPFERLLREQPEISLAMMRVLCDRIKETAAQQRSASSSQLSANLLDNQQVR